MVVYYTLAECKALWWRACKKEKIFTKDELNDRPSGPKMYSIPWQLQPFDIAGSIQKCPQVSSFLGAWNREILLYCSVLPGYLEWWLDSNLHLVLFIQYILNSVSIAYICII